MKKTRGFTLIEMLVVIAIVGIVVSIIASSIHNKKLSLNGAVKAYACGFFVDCPTTPTTVQTVVKSVEVPQLTSSSERANVAERAMRFDDPKKISYVYLVSYGKVMAFYTAKGKVSSLNSFMTPTQKIECKYSNGASCVTLDTPDIDGTYGQNVEGIFFFTTEGAYVEWKGDYMMSDQPLALSTQPELVRTIK